MINNIYANPEGRNFGLNDPYADKYLNQLSVQQMEMNNVYT